MGDAQKEWVPLHELVFGYKRLFEIIMGYAADFILNSAVRSSVVIDRYFMKSLCDTRFVDRVFSRTIGNFLFERVCFEVIYVEDRDSIEPYDQPYLQDRVLKGESIRRAYSVRFIRESERGRWFDLCADKITSLSLACKTKVPYEAIERAKNLTSLSLTIDACTLDVDRLPRRLEKLYVRDPRLFQSEGAPFAKGRARITGAKWPDALTKICLVEAAKGSIRVDEDTLTGLRDLKSLAKLCIDDFDIDPRALRLPDSLKVLASSIKIATNAVLNKGLEKYRSIWGEEKAEGGLDTKNFDILKMKEFLCSQTTVSTSPEEVDACKIERLNNILFRDRVTGSPLWPSATLVTLDIFGKPEGVLLEYSELPVLPNLKKMRVDGARGTFDARVKTPALTDFYHKAYRTFDLELRANHRLKFLTLDVEGFESRINVDFSTGFGALKCLTCSFGFYKTCESSIPAELKVLVLNLNDQPAELSRLPPGLLALSLWPDYNYRSHLGKNAGIAWPRGLKFAYLNIPLSRDEYDALPESLEYLWIRSHEGIKEGIDFGRLTNLRHFGTRCFDDGSEPPHTFGPNVLTKHPTRVKGNPGQTFNDLFPFVCEIVGTLINSRHRYPFFDLEEFVGCVMPKYEAQNR